MNDRRRWLGCGLFLGLVLLAAAPAASDEPTEEESSYWEKARELYEQAKDAGEQVPGTLSDWVAADVQSIGTWEYRVVTVESLDKLEEELTRLGDERWDCIWIEAEGKRRRLVLKRSKRSYLGTIRWMDLMKMLTGGESAGE